MRKILMEQNQYFETKYQKYLPPINKGPAILYRSNFLKQLTLKSLIRKKPLYKTNIYK